MGRPVTMLAVDETGVLVKTGPVKVKAIQFHNDSAGDVHVQMFNAAQLADVTIGTTVPDWSPGTHADAGAVDVLQMSNLDLSFSKGLVIAATVEPDGNTAPTTSGSVGAVNLELADG